MSKKRVIFSGTVEGNDLRGASGGTVKLHDGSTVRTIIGSCVEGRVIEVGGKLVVQVPLNECSFVGLLD